MFRWLRGKLGNALAKYLDQPTSRYQAYSIQPTRTLRQVLKPADVLLVEGNKRISTAIKYLTQSTWSHAALYIGDALGRPSDNSEPKVLIEADLQNGVIASPLSIYENFNTRICRPAGLSDDERKKVVEFMVGNLGIAYDLKNVIDLMRYLLPQPPVPGRWRRQMLELGSGSPTRAICSTLIAQAFHSVQYPIIPLPSGQTVYAYERGRFTSEEILGRRHHTLHTPRDFDLSPYFQVVKPTLELGFDHRKIVWQGDVTTEFRPARLTK
jgi:hypothetical protein